MSWNWRASVLTLALCTLGCADNFYGAYKRSHPDWFPTFPASDIGLEETLASVYAPPTGGYQIVVSKLEIYRTDTTPWQAVPAGDLTSAAFVPSDAHDYAIAVLVWCSSEVDLERFNGERASWYLLPKNRVTYYDH